MNIVLLHPYHGRNIGDCAVFSGVIEDYSEYFPEANFVLPVREGSLNEASGGLTNHIKERTKLLEYKMGNLARINPLFSRGIFNLIKNADLIVVTGEIFHGQLVSLDMGNIYRVIHAIHPLSINFIQSYYLLFKYAKHLEKPFIIYNFDYTPTNSLYLRKKIEDLMIKSVLKDASSAIARTKITYEKTKNEINFLEVKLGSDPSLNSIPPNLLGHIGHIEENKIETRENNIRIGINLTYGFGTYYRSNYRSIKIYLIKIREIIQKLQNKYDAYIYILPTHFNDIKLASNFLKMFKDVNSLKIIDPSKKNYVQYINLLNSFDVFIGSRFHSVMLSIVAECPTFTIAYRPKVKSVAEEVFPKRFVIKDNELSDKINITDRIEYLIENKYKFKNRIKAQKKKLNIRRRKVLKEAIEGLEI